MNKAKLLLVTGLLSAPVFGLPLSLDWDFQVSGSQTEHRHSVLFPDSYVSSSENIDAVLDVQVEANGFTGLVAFKANDLYHSDASVSYDSELIVQEAFWQGGLFDLPIDMTLGKVRLDWGVGYGYRPLDLFKPYRRNPVGIQVEEGAGTLLASYFDMSGEWSLVYTDSSWTQQEGSDLEQAAQQQGAGVRRYALLGDTEWQAIAYYDDVRKGLVGGSIVTVFDQAWSLHGSAVYQREYLTYQQHRANVPVSLTTEDNGFQALVGLNWANSTGNNIILEYWFDNRGWSHSEWQSAFSSASGMANVGQTQLASSYAQGLNQVNLVQHNVMFHWSLDSSSWSHWEWSQSILWLEDLTPTFDVLYSPQDQGVIATQWLDYQLFDSGTISFSTEFAARFMTGDKESVYANLSDKRMIFINLKGKF
ncbi:hypothetical protein F0231_11425 [Vibrio sp. RE86]|uniref:hypothetical protein n=1 Tax=Vibrio sp. RE86 TaxID=2607605 RepID=UPI001493C5D8|nr:hypothetical protein [Vibrio sp. RE86]NOH80347.1 hypothetical protein [Vibrio sp. RE86]